MRKIHLLFSLLLFAPECQQAAEDQPFSFEVLEEKARSLSSNAFVPFNSVPAALTGLNYDQYRAIRPSGRSALDASANALAPFRIEFMHPGYLFPVPVKINFLDPEDRTVEPYPFDPELFDYENLVLEEGFDPERIRGYAGFRIQHPLYENPNNFDEIGSFVGSSYFRLLGREQRYGLSARGLALNVAHHETAEEFPVFTEYWIVKPRAGDEALEIYALLESPSVTGAYHFIITPGESTRAFVRVSLAFRKDIHSLGIAPLTSMYWFGENCIERKAGDWRPEVHDSDGLLFHTWNDERVWRPLCNQGHIRYTFFNAPDVKGFGLLQRDRDFQHYQDLSNPYHQTPSAWVEPGENWGEGAVRLIELPTGVEGEDNIVAFYEPKEKATAGSTLKYSYTLSMMLEEEKQLSPDHVEQTRVGVIHAFPDTRRFVVNFNGPNLSKLSADAPVWAEITSSTNGYITENQCFKNVFTGGWRVEFKLDTDDSNTEPVELRCTLKSTPDNRTLSETWSYQWSP